MSQHETLTVGQVNARRCRVLRDRGLKLREIAELTGLSISSVDHYLSDPDGSKARARKMRGRCCDCGRAIRSDSPTRGNPMRCSPCASANYASRTRKEMESAYRTWIAWYGRRPGAMDWNLAHARRVASPVRLAAIEAAHQERRWPSSSGVIKKFGSWNAFVAHMGDLPVGPGIRLDPVAWRSQLRRAQRSRRKTSRETWAEDLSHRWNSGEPVTHIAKAQNVARETIYRRVAVLRKEGYQLVERRIPVDQATGEGVA